MVIEPPKGGGVMCYLEIVSVFLKGGPSHLFPVSSDVKNPSDQHGTEATHHSFPAGI